MCGPFFPEKKLVFIRTGQTLWNDFLSLNKLQGCQRVFEDSQSDCQRNGTPREVCSDGLSIFMAHESSGELCVQSLKRLLREYVSEEGCLNNDAVTQALLAYSNTLSKILGLCPAQISFGWSLKDFFPKSVESLTPVPENLLSAVVKEQKQIGIRSEAGRRLNLHTKVLKELEVGDCVQLQNLSGKHP